MIIFGCIGFALLAIIVLALGAAFWAWVLMLVAGAVGFTFHGHTPGFVTCLPVGALLALIIGALQQNGRRG